MTVYFYKRSINLFPTVTLSLKQSQTHLLFGHIRYSLIHCIGYNALTDFF